MWWDDKERLKMVRFELLLGWVERRWLAQTGEGRRRSFLVSLVI